MPPAYDLIKDITGGRCTIRGRITALDDKPSTVSVGKEGRITPLFHFSLTDTSATIQGTAWDCTSQHKLLTLGAVVVVRNVLAKPCRHGFSDYHDFAFNFTKTSSLEIQLDDASLPHREKIRPQGERPLIDLTDGEGTKRTRSTSESLTQSEPVCCETPSEPFCTTTGLPHPPVCVLCGGIRSKKMFCPKTGERHAREDDQNI